MTLPPMSTSDHPFALAYPHGEAVSAVAHWRICGFILALVVLAATLSALRKDVTQGFDELAHASYVAHLQHTGEVWPALEDMRMLDPARFAFTGRANYLNHPAPYYALLAGIGPTLEGHPRAIVVDRLLNVAIAAAALAALMAIGLAARLSRLALYAYVVPLACIPILVSLGGAVNNDNAAFAGGALAILAAWQLIATGRSAWLLAALTGVVIASWAKLTGMLLAGGMLAGVLGWLLWRGRFRREWIVPIVVAALLAVAPYAALMLQYGSPAPNTPGQIMMLKAGALAAGWDHAARMSPAAYAVHFAVMFVMQWMPTLLPRNALNFAALVIPVATVMCAFAGVMLSVRRILGRREGPLDVVVTAGAIAFIATLVVHVLFSYERHVAYGWMMDAYPRYYLPLAAVVPLAGLSLLGAIENQRLRLALAGFLIVGPILFRLIGTPLPAVG